jgi:hypothetical protein
MADGLNDPLLPSARIIQLLQNTHLRAYEPAASHPTFVRLTIFNFGGYCLW